MKKITFMFAVLLLGISMQLQAQSAIDKIFEKYDGKPGFTSVTMNKNMFEIMSRIDTTAQGREFSKTVAKLEVIKILTIEDKAAAGNVDLYTETMKSMPVKEYKELMSVKEDGTDIKFFVREKGDNISELLLIVGGKDEDNALIVIKGDIDLASIGSLGRSMHIESFEQLDHLNKK